MMTVPNVAFPTFLKKLAIAASFYLFLPIQPHDDSVMIFIPQPLCKGLFYNGTNRPIFAYFYSFQILMLHKKWNLQGYSNSDRRSRRQARWPIDPYHSPRPGSFLNLPIVWMTDKLPSLCIIVSQAWLNSWQKSLEMVKHILV